MKKIFLLLFAIFTVATNAQQFEVVHFKAGQDEQTTLVSKELSKYFLDFILKAKINSVDLSNLKGLRGVFRSQQRGYSFIREGKFILINSSSDLQVILYHELAHILLDRIEHCDGRHDCLMLNMSGEQVVIEILEEDLDLYLQELFDYLNKKH